MFWIMEKLMFGKRSHQFIITLCKCCVIQCVCSLQMLQELGLCTLWIDAWGKPLRDGILENA